MKQVLTGMSSISKSKVLANSIAGVALTCCHTCSLICHSYFVQASKQGQFGMVYEIEHISSPQVDCTEIRIMSLKKTQVASSCVFSLAMGTDEACRD